MPRVIAFLHPLLALASILFLAWVASLGLRSRDRVDRHLRPRHARLARWAYGLMIGNFVAGVLTTWALRPDLSARGAMHLRLGLAIVLLMSGAALLSRWIGTNETARLLHPILGLLALVLSGLQLFFGMPLLPL
jgi:hypothetical protein